MTASLFADLRNLLSYKTEDGSYYGGYPAQTRYLIDKKGEFPAGLLTRVTGWFKETRVAYRITNTCIRPSPAVRKQLRQIENPYPWQLKAVERAKLLPRGIISATTGSGKSIAICMLIAELPVKNVLIVTPTVGLREQLTETVTHYFGKNSNILVRNIDSTDLPTITNVDMLIIDEGHHAAAATYRKLNKTAWKSAYYRYFFTATPWRTQESEQLIFEGVAGTILYRLDYTQAVKAGYVVPIEAYYIDLPKIKNDLFSYSQVYSSLIVNNNTRNSLISDLLTSLNERGAATLCLVKEVAHGRHLNAFNEVPFITAEDPHSRVLLKDFNSSKIKTLVGTVGVLGEGVDTKACEFILIAGLGKAKNSFMQWVGRALRTSPGKTTAKVILFRDPSHKFTLRHYKAQVKILKEEYGVEPQKLDL